MQAAARPVRDCLVTVVRTRPGVESSGMRSTAPPS